MIYFKNLKKLRRIGGCKAYHNEGNAFTHTLLVYKAAKKIFHGSDRKMMLKVAILHDIGKISCGKKKENGDWEYPYHSPVGGKVLDQFLPKNDPDFLKIQWYITNHIKPLFWREEKDIEKVQKNLIPGVSIRNLALLAIADLMGSYTDEEHKEDKKKNIRNLWKIANTGTL